MSIKLIHHVCIQTEKYEESFEFYTKILGFELVKEVQNFHDRAFNTWLKLGSFMLELQTCKAEKKFGKYSQENEGIAHMCFLVEDIHKEISRIKSLGYSNFKVKNGEEIYRVEAGELFKLIAPEGTVIEFRDSEI